jgi:hypothetical protein
MSAMNAIYTQLQEMGIDPETATNEQCETAALIALGNENL